MTKPDQVFGRGKFRCHKSQEHYGFQKGKRRKTTQTYQVDPQQSWTHIILVGGFDTFEKYESKRKYSPRVKEEMFESTTYCT